jgi:hypothetical protein
MYGCIGRKKFCAIQEPCTVECALVLKFHPLVLLVSGWKISSLTPSSLSLLLYPPPKCHYISFAAAPRELSADKRSALACCDAHLCRPSLLLRRIQVALGWRFVAMPRDRCCSLGMCAPGVGLLPSLTWQYFT